MFSRIIKYIKNKIIIWQNRFLFSLQIKRKGYFFEVIILEKYKQYVKTLKIIFTFIGLFSVFITFQSALIAFLFGLLIYVISTIIEKFTFSYTTFYVSPLPDFEIKNEKWTGMYFGYAEYPKEDGTTLDIPIVGMLFSDDEYAKEIHKLLLTWSYGNLKDEDNNIIASVILNNNDSYIFFCYPNPERRTAKQFYKKYETKMKEEIPNEVHSRIFMCQILGKRCEITQKSYFPTFRKRYKSGIPYHFQLGKIKDNEIEKIEGIDDLILFNLKIKNKSELNRKDIEFDLLKLQF